MTIKINGTESALMAGGAVQPVRAGQPRAFTLDDVKRLGKPQKGLPQEVNDWRSDNWKHHLSQRGYPELSFAQKAGLAHTYGAMLPTVVRDGQSVPFGLASLRVVTNAGVAFIVNAFLNTTELENMRFHGIGSGAVAENVADTALGAEFTTQLNPDNTRATGTQVAFASNIFQTVATNNVDAAVANTEHGIFSQAATGGGTLLDRSVYAAINLASGDGIATDYRLTFTAGG